MFLWYLLKTNPMSAMALLMSLATLFCCLRLLRWQHTKMERYLMGVLGLIAMYQGLQILQTAGFWAIPVRMQSMTGVADVAIAGLYFASTLLIQFASRDRHNTRIQLRVVEAQQPLGRPAKPLQLPPERTALAVFGVTSTGEVNLWHNSSEEFFGWRTEEVMGTRLPFKELDQECLSALRGESGLPRLIGLRTRHEEDLEALAWFMPVPGESGSLVLVLDYRKARKPQAVRSHAAAPNLARAQFSAIG